MPAGKTEPLKVQWLGAFNHPLEDPAIRIKFDDYIDPVEATPERIRVEPAVEKMKLLASNDEIEITGELRSQAALQGHDFAGTKGRSRLRTHR